MTGIYAIFNKINGKKYVGSSVNIYKRKAEHYLALNDNKHHSFYLQRAWNKYKPESFEFILLEKVEKKENLLIREQWWLDNSNSKYNVCKIAGNTLGRKTSKSTRDKISKALKGRISTKQIEAQKNRRKPVDQYDIEGNFMKGWDSSQDAAAFYSKSHKLIINAANGRCNIAFGYRWTYKGNKLIEIRRSNQKFIYQFGIDGVFIKKWYTLQEAASFYKVNASCITDCAKGKQKTSAGFIWKYEK